MSWSPAFYGWHRHSDMVRFDSWTFKEGFITFSWVTEITTFLLYFISRLFETSWIYLLENIVICVGQRFLNWGVNWGKGDNYRGKKNKLKPSFTAVSVSSHCQKLLRGNISVQETKLFCKKWKRGTLAAWLTPLFEWCFCHHGNCWKWINVLGK